MQVFANEISNKLIKKQKIKCIHSFDGLLITEKSWIKGIRVQVKKIHKHKVKQLATMVVRRFSM